MNTINEEGVLDRAARLKREAEAKVASTINGLKLQRALFLTAFLGAAGYAGYLHLNADELRKTSAANAVKAEAAAAEITKQKSENATAIEQYRAQVEEAKNKTALVESSYASKLQSAEAELSGLRAERTALQTRLDASLAPTTVVTVSRTNEGASSGLAPGSAIPAKSERTIASLVTDTSAQPITKENLPQLVQLYNGIDATVKKACESQAEITDTHRRAVARAFEFYKVHKAVLDAQAELKGFKITLLEPRFMASYDPNAEWKPVSRKQGGYAEYVTTRRNILQKAAPVVHAIAIALDPSRKSL